MAPFCPACRFFGLLFVYLAAGMVFNRTSRQASGLELIPNIAFWQALPSLVKVSTDQTTVNRSEVRF